MSEVRQTTYREDFECSHLIAHPRHAGTSSFGMSGINCHLVFGHTAMATDPASSPDLWKIPSWGSDPPHASRTSSGGLARHGSSPLGLQHGTSRVSTLAGMSSLKTLKSSGSGLDRLLRSKDGSGAMHRGLSGLSRKATAGSDEWHGRLGAHKIIRERRRWWGLPPISRLLSACVSSAVNGVARFACHLGAASLAYLHDHRYNLFLQLSNPDLGILSGRCMQADCRQAVPVLVKSYSESHPLQVGEGHRLCLNWTCLDL